MEAATEGGVKPRSQRGGPATNLNRLAIRATNHCLTGCAIGEISGFVIATSLGWSDFGTLALEAGVGDPVIYIAVAVGFVVAYPFTFVANRYLIVRGKGHALVHEYHHH